ncbi:DUF6515 family protein [Gammaproteobacteria bacterium]|jgi:hypothetical protein|nr:hypothetical protein [Gammaproteobacteria bacterium]MDC3267453.1 DUF6515 family protein [bacterium]MBT6482903.1 hypothetical protein [Gammaproteobacteria bacterium]MBT7225004.1 hypothetical protein [Gammaproteobacteria bacterium]MDB3898493.1 DUF6515 family protein [Gammaproteobacteria bacterium]
MKLFSTTSVIGYTLGCAMLLSATSASADPLHRGIHRHGVVHSHQTVNTVVVTPAAPIRTVTRVSASRLNRLPATHVRFVHNDETFFYSEGVYYQKKGRGYIIVKPRAGFRVATLPRGYRVIREGNVKFYSFNNVRYRKRNGFFVVV